MQKSNNPEKKSFVFKALNAVERLGNKLPHPITLFAEFCLGIMIISAILAAMGVSETGELFNQKTGLVETQVINVQSLLSGSGLAYMLTNAISNFTSFAPLGVVLVAMLGIGVAEGSGYISAVLRKIVSITPKQFISPVIVFLGVMSNIASDAGYIVLIPLGAMMFMAFGRHPIAGLAAAFAGVSGGFSANLIVGSTDALLAGIAHEAARIYDPTYTVDATANFYFMFVSTFLITILGTIVTDKIVEPRLGTFVAPDDLVVNMDAITPTEQKALTRANMTMLGLIVLLCVSLVPQNSFLRNPATGSILSGSPFMTSIVVLIAILFFVPAVVYGFTSGEYKSDKDVGKSLGDAMSSMGSYVALSFVMAQFVNYFTYTNLGTIIALKGARFLTASGLSGPFLMIIFILLTALINLLMSSASAKWAIMAPIFIPMFMAANYSPELIQTAYRIGDSSTNIISPLMSYLPMIVVFAQKYNKKAGMGTIVSTMLPYSMTFLFFWSVMLVIWMTLGLPVGIGAPLYLS